MISSKINNIHNKGTFTRSLYRRNNMITFMIITTILLFLADMLNEYWNIDVTPDDITIIFGKDEGHDIK